MGIKSYLLPSKAGEPPQPRGSVSAARPPVSGKSGKSGKVGNRISTMTTMTAMTGMTGMSGMSGMTGTTSNRGSFVPGSSRSYPSGDFRNAAESLIDIKADVMCNWLYQQQLELQYASGLYPGEGVVLKKAKNSYACCPPGLHEVPGGLYDMAMELNVRCAMTVNTRVINVILSSRRNASDFIPMPDGLRLQVLPSMADLPRCQKHHFAAFIQDIQILVVWDDEPKKLLSRADLIERNLMRMVWGAGDEDPEAMEEEKGGMMEQFDEIDLEAASVVEERQFKLTSPLMVSGTISLCLGCMGLGGRNLAYQIATDDDYTRLALLLVMPAQIFCGLFFFQIIMTNLFQCFGPIGAVDQNSKNYSGLPTRRLNRELRSFPHVTIQMPVYKEGLNAVIRPTVASLKQAISTYEMQGGTANIFINDDGMQLIPEDEAQARRDYYDENNVGWVSRPKHNPRPENGEMPFLRRGKFKKASNMNYSLMISNRVEDKLVKVARTANWTDLNEDAAYESCLAQVLQEDEGRTWAEGNIRIGDYILLIDSDTRVPVDCMLDAVSELEDAPEVSVLQFSSGVMQVTTSFFESGITWFTNLVYSAITFVTANGDNCPFVGHNAFLRWSSIQDAASYYDEDKYEKFWSESHVSEDFDMALRLQCAGYLLRFATYAGDGFKEGVSLTVYDELARWEKYAYGCNELLFHPLIYWPKRGPFTPLFKTFMFTGAIQFPKKITIMAYIGTYYAIGSTWALTLMNYFLTGWYFGVYDKYYIDSFAIYISIIVVFTAFGNFALAILRYRLNQQSLLGAFVENFKWIPLMTIFLGGLSLHVSQALLWHFLSIDLTWGATAKEVEEVNFGEEIPRLFRRFKGTFFFSFSMVALMICGKYAFPAEWRIVHFASIWPLGAVTASHFLLPVVLNPALMKFTW